MDKKTIGIIVIILAILACAYQFIYVPYQNEQANQNFNKGLQNISAIEDDINQSLSNLDKLNTSNITYSLEIIRDTWSNNTQKLDSEMEILNQTRTYANGNETKEKYIDYLIDYCKIEQDLTKNTIQAYTDLIDANNKNDINKQLNISNEMRNDYNKKVDQCNEIKGNIINLLNDNPEFNQTLHDLNLSEGFYNHTNLTHIQ